MAIHQGPVQNLLDEFCVCNYLLELVLIEAKLCHQNVSP
jgi:hypothetical protein